MKKKDEYCLYQGSDVYPNNNKGFNFIYNQIPIKIDSKVHYPMDLMIHFPMDRNDEFIKEQQRKHPELEVIERLLKTLKGRADVHHIQIFYRDDNQEK